MIIWSEAIHIATSFIARNPNLVLGNGWCTFVHLKVFARCVARRIKPARHQGRETLGADRNENFVNKGVPAIHGVNGRTGGRWGQAQRLR